MIFDKIKGKGKVKMRKNYFAKLVRYMKNAYHSESGLYKLSDGRFNPTYSTGQGILPALLGFLLRIKSFNELNLIIKNNELKLFPEGQRFCRLMQSEIRVIDI